MIITGALRTMKSTVYLRTTTSALTSTTEKKKKKILVAVDHSEYSRVAFNTALEVMHPDDHLFILNVPEIPSGTFSFNSLNSNINMKLVLETAIERSKRLIESYNKECRQAGIKHHTGLVGKEFDAIRKEILDTIREANIDYLVLGSRGLGFVSRAMLGSHANYMVLHAPCNTLIAKQKHQDLKEGEEKEAK